MIFISCFHPSFVLQVIESDTGDYHAKWLGGEKTVLNMPEVQAVLRSGYDGIRKLSDFKRVNLDRYRQIVQVPCGKCIGCRMDYSRSWADRMTYHVFGREEYSYFITLTYDDNAYDQLNFSPDYGIGSLDYSHMDEFIKSLRNKFRDAQIDMYYAGEYGDQLMRTHFHLIVYNMFIPDLEFWKLDDLGQPVYTSDIIHKLWKKGICSISMFSWNNAAYTARYVQKKRDGRALCEYTACGLEPEKARMSRRPGIGYEYYMEHHSDLWKNGGMSVPRDINHSGHLGIPRYFRKLAHKKDNYEEHVPEFLAFQQSALDRMNILSPIELQNSSFDLDSIGKLLEFQERELLNLQKVNKL